MLYDQLRIPWELLADPWGSAEHTLGTAGLEKYEALVLTSAVF